MLLIQWITSQNRKSSKSRMHYNTSFRSVLWQLDVLTPGKLLKLFSVFHTLPYKKVRSRARVVSYHTHRSTNTHLAGVENAEERETQCRFSWLRVLWELFSVSTPGPWTRLCFTERAHTQIHTHTRAREPASHSRTVNYKTTTDHAQTPYSKRLLTHLC